MATGYTADIAKGISFTKFCLSCSRAFGALVTMRDDPAEAEILDEFKPSDYHEKELKKVEKELADFLALLIKDGAKQMQKEYQAEWDQIEEWKREREELKLKYQAMLSKVADWIPPTKDHQGLKDFMIQQIQTSIDFDCRCPDEPKQPKSLEYWKSMKIAELSWSVDYHQKENEKEITRAQERTAWVKQLKTSLGI